jgi:putative sigma-54 modulation protein
LIGRFDMQIAISTRHGTLQDSARQHIHDKAEKLLHIFDRITMINVTVDLQDELRQMVEIQVDAEHKHDFVASEHHPDVLAAMDLALDKIRQQVRRYKEKIQEHHRG